MSAIFSCREALRLATEALEHPLPWRKRLAFRIHLLACDACRVYLRQVRALDRLVRARGPQADADLELDDAARARIAAALRRARQQPPQ